MHRSGQVDSLLHYQAVLVSTAIRAVRETPPIVKVRDPAVNGRSWHGGLINVRGWRAAAIAAGAVSRD